MAKRVTKHTQEESMEQLSTTEVSPAVARAMSWTFVVILCAVPLLQIAWEVGHAQKPQVSNLFRPLLTGQVRTVISRAFLHGFEADLERVSIAKSYVQPRAQNLLTGVGGFGNDKGVVGRDGWLFYQPGIDYVAGRNFIEASHLREAARKMVDKQREQYPHPDPRPAIQEFAAQLRKQGIWLVVLPAPEKASFQPAQLLNRMNARQAVVTPNNAGYAAFVRDMRAAGVDIFDVTPGQVTPGEFRFLQQDTHWTPQFMDDVSTHLAEHISQVVTLPAKPSLYELREQTVSRVGDIVDMLGLTKDQHLYLPQTVRVQMVVDKTAGKPLEPDATADVLVLGDSYTNIYSQAEMGWGSSGGFAEHLAYHLQRPVDVIAFNGGGASRTRGELARPENAARLGYKKVVVFQFAARDLLGANWTPSPVVAGKAPPVPSTPVAANPATSHQDSDPSKPITSESRAMTGTIPKRLPPTPAIELDAIPAASLIVIGQIVKTSTVPRPGSVPYKDCLAFVKIRVEGVESGTYSEPEMVVAFQVMKDSTLLPAAEYSVGDRVRIKLLPLNKAERPVRSMQRADDLDDLTHQPYYVLEGKRQ